MQSPSLLLAAALAWIPLQVGAGDYHVAPTGDDRNSGSADEPWATIQHAAEEARAGDTVRIHTGVYPERVVFPHSGTEAEGFITFKALAGAEVIVDGAGRTVSGRQGLLEIIAKSYLRLEGFVVRNHQSPSSAAVPVGILVEGGGEHLEIVGNEIREIASTATVNGSLNGRDAHGLGVFGTDLTPISHLLIRDNEIHHLTLGSSEALVVNGNVAGFQVLDNRVWDCDNIGIDLIGFEGVAPTEALDQAREGVVAGNRVWNIDTSLNPSYGGETSAAGIYVDGGRDIVVERNTVHHCNIGVEVASEHAGKVTRAITVRNNLLFGNEMGGLFIGGYNSGSTGDAEDCVITSNTFYDNDTDPLADSYGQIYIQFRVSNCVFRNNILCPLVVKDGQYNPMIVHWNGTGSGNVFDHNLYFGAETPVWVMKNVWREGWVQYEGDPLSGGDERFGDPAFANAPLEDFTPMGIAALGTGDPLSILPGERDLEGDLRLSGLAVDRGAVQSGRERSGTLPLAVSQAASVLKLLWPSRAGFYYDVEALFGEDWEVVPGSEATEGTGGEMTFTRTMDGGASILRVRER